MKHKPLYHRNRKPLISHEQRPSLIRSTNLHYHMYKPLLSHGPQTSTITVTINLSRHWKCKPSTTHTNHNISQKTTNLYHLDNPQLTSTTKKQNPQTSHFNRRHTISPLPRNHINCSLQSFTLKQITQSIISQKPRDPSLPHNPHNPHIFPSTIETLLTEHNRPSLIFSHTIIFLTS